MLPAGGVVQHRFCQRVPVRVSGDEQRTNSLRCGRAARFAGADDLNSEALQKTGKPGDLGRFSGPVAALEGLSACLSRRGVEAEQQRAQPPEDTAEEADPLDIRPGV